MYVTEAQVAEVLTPAEALAAVRVVLRAARARRGRQPAARAHRAARRRARGHAVRRPRARVRRLEDVRVAAGRRVVSRRAVLARDRRARRGRRGGHARAAAHRSRVCRRRAACSHATVRERSACSAAAARLRRTWPRCGRRCRRSRRFVSAGRERRSSRERQAAGGCDVVVTATTSKEPVLHGEWLREGAFVCAIGANDPESRELDDAVLERASVRLHRLARAVAARGGRPDRPRSTGRRCPSCRTSSRARARPHERARDRALQVERARSVGPCRSRARRRVAFLDLAPVSAASHRPLQSVPGTDAGIPPARPECLSHEWFRKGCGRSVTHS